MTKLVMGKDAIEVKAARKQVLANLRMLNSRLQELCSSSASYDALHAFYSEKVEEQLNILEWFEKFDARHRQRISEIVNWTGAGDSFAATPTP